MSRTRVLLVEDDALQAQGIQKQLARLGYNVVGVAASEEQAMALLASTSPDLVLMDIQLAAEEVDGIAIAEHIRACCDLPVVFLTAYANDELLQRAKAAGSFGYLLKPSRKDEIRTTIEMALYQHALDRQLREVATRYQQLFETISSGVAVYEAVDGGADFVFKDFNRAAERIDGVSRIEVIGRRLTEVFPGVEAFGLLDVLRRVWRTGVPEEFPARLYQDERIVGWRENHVYKLPSGEVVAVYDDVSERKRIEAEAEQNRRFLQTLLDHLPLVLFVKDTQTGRFLLWNTLSAEVTGLPAEQVLGKTDYEVFPRELADAFRREDVALIEHRSVIDNPAKEYYSPKFGKRVYHSQKVPVFDEEGKPVYILGISLDVTARKQAEEALRRERDLLRQMMATSPVGVTVVDREGRITFANARAEEALGLTRDAITQRMYNAAEWEITDYDGNPFPDEMLPFRRVRETRQPVYDVQHAIRWPDGRRVLLRIHAAPLFDEVGEFDGAVCAFENVTERVEEERRRREQLARELRELESLSAPPHTSVTAQAYGQQPLRTATPAIFSEMVEQYSRLIERAMEQQTYRVQQTVSDDLRALAQRLGRLSGGPRDVVDLHSAALRSVAEGAPPARARAYAEEGRLVALELMGYLTSYYRNRLLGQ